jgi:hypothetical protein
MAFLKHGVERLGKIISARLFRPRVITELCFPVHKTLVPFVDYRQSERIAPIDE